MRASGVIGVSLAITTMLSGCAGQSGTNSSSNWQIDAVAQKCIGAVVIGTGVGALIGAAAGGGRGMAIGAGAGLAAGGITCAVIAALDAQDRERIRLAQLAAVASGKDQDLAYAGTDGAQRQIKVRPRPSPAVAQQTKPRRNSSTTPTQVSVPEGPICRIVDTSAAIAGKGTTEVPPQKFCRNPNGDWEPVADTTT